MKFTRALLLLGCFGLSPFTTFCTDPKSSPTNRDSGSPEAEAADGRDTEAFSDTGESGMTTGDVDMEAGAAAATRSNSSSDGAGGTVPNPSADPSGGDGETGAQASGGAGPSNETPNTNTGGTIGDPETSTNADGGSVTSDDGFDCLVSCDDGFSCTVDSCRFGECAHSIGPADGTTACPVGQYCVVENGCVLAPACATDEDCEEAWATDPCKTVPRCDPASSVCLFDYLDKDGDGYSPQVCGGDDCNDDDWSIRPGLDVLDHCDSVDNDCDGSIDEGNVELELTACSNPLSECVDGVCRCPEEYQCGSDCTDKTTDPYHCGACDRACPSDGLCAEGECECPVGTMLCGDACADLTTDIDHCGSCNTSCPNGASCDTGACACPVDFEVCDEQCVELASDFENCGACGNACQEGETCCGGQCTDTDADDANCRTCGRVCSSELSCINADCVYADPVRFTDVSAGGLHSCAVKEDGTIVCWGSFSQRRPTELVDQFESVSCGYSHTCGVTLAGAIKCWGSNDHGQGTPPSGTFAAVSAGQWHTCALRTDGAIACWGNNDQGQASAPPGQFTSVASGGFHTCALREDGSAACWGRNDFNQSTPPSGVFTQIATGDLHTCALTADGTRRCWGNGNAGQFDDPNFGPIRQLVAGGGQTCGVTTTSFAFCVGSTLIPAPNYLGQNQLNYARVSAGLSHTCGIISGDSMGGTLVCWGNNEYGQAEPPEFRSPECFGLTSMPAHTWRSCTR